jgi:hypothetical protein
VRTGSITVCRRGGGPHADRAGTRTSGAPGGTPIPRGRRPGAVGERRRGE